MSPKNSPESKSPIIEYLRERDAEQRNNARYLAFLANFGYRAPYQDAGLHKPMPNFEKKTVRDVLGTDPRIVRARILSAIGLAAIFLYGIFRDREVKIRACEVVESTCSPVSHALIRAMGNDWEGDVTTDSDGFAVIYRPWNAKVGELEVFGSEYNVDGKCFEGSQEVKKDEWIAIFASCE